MNRALPTLFAKIKPTLKKSTKPLNSNVAKPFVNIKPTLKQKHVNDGMPTVFANIKKSQTQTDNVILQ